MSLLHSSCLQSTIDISQTSLSCGSKVYVGLRAQSPNSYGTEKPSLNVEFHNQVYKSIALRSSGSKPTRGRVSMMPIGTPRVPYRNVAEGTWQWVDLWNALYRERVIFIGQHIDEEFSNQILATMLYLDSVDDSKKLFFYINGPGGDLTPSMAIYDTMQSLKSPIGTHCVGFAYNLATFLLAAGEKGYRYAMPLSRIALQSPAGSARGQELIEKLSKGELPKNDYPCMNDPSPTFHGTAQGASVRTGQLPPPHSMRSRRTATWARPRNSDDGYSSDSISRHASSDFTKMGQRIFVFIVGGATRSELRVCHKLSTKLKREIVLGSSSLDDPPQFITKLKLLTANELSLDDLQI